MSYIGRSDLREYHVWRHNPPIPRGWRAGVQSDLSTGGLGPFRIDFESAQDAKDAVEEYDELKGRHPDV